MKKLIVIVVMILISACTATKESFTHADGKPVKIANPASEYCVKKGGRLVSKKNGAGSVYGVCFFKNNFMCEEWAMFRGDCPMGGVKLSDNLRDEVHYCVISGGKYQVIVSETQTEHEQGNCLLPSGKICNALSLFNGKC